MNISLITELPAWWILICFLAGILYAFVLNMLHEHGRKWLARCRNTVATRFSTSDPDDREALSSKCRESRSIPRNQQWARPGIEL